jgi:hypothetical protein
MMAGKRFIPGRFVRLTLPDGSYGYGRLREDDAVAIYNFHTQEPVSDLDVIAAKPILFTVYVHRSVISKWEVIDKKPLEAHLKEPAVWFWQDIGDFRNCKIVDSVGNEKPATPEACEGLERLAVWEGNGVEKRLLDMFMDRPNPTVEHQKVRYEDYHPHVKRKSGDHSAELK